MGNETIPACDGRQLRITVSVGVVELLPEDADPAVLLQRASNMVQEAKLGGRNRVQS